MEEGVVAGGGTIYIRRALSALKDLKGDNADEQTGINIVERAITSPLRQIVAVTLVVKVSKLLSTK